MPLNLGKGSIQTVEKGQIVITSGDRSFCLDAIVIHIKSSSAMFQFEECVKDGDVTKHKPCPMITISGDAFLKLIEDNPEAHALIKKIGYEVIQEATGETGEIV